jgi:hypothetical protein
MCCTGRCHYENYMGDCTVGKGQPWPEDAYCNDPHEEEESDGYEDLYQSLQEWDQNSHR